MKDNIIGGIHPIKEALRNKKEFSKVLIVQSNSNADIKTIESELKSENIPVQKVPKVKLDKLAKFNHQGIVGLLALTEFVELDDIIELAHSKNEPPLVLLLDGLTDTRNVGAICRTAECMGVHGIVIPSSGSAQIGAGVVKSSSGAALRMNFCRVPHLLDAVYHLQSSEIPVVACHEAAELEVSDFETDKNGIALIMGAEDKGINPRLIKASDNQLKIQMYGSIGSLNVSVACGMVLYQIRKNIA